MFASFVKRSDRGFVGGCCAVLWGLGVMREKWRHRRKEERGVKVKKKGGQQREEKTKKMGGPRMRERGKEKE